jgi:hypothetical protein
MHRLDGRAQDDEITGIFYVHDISSADASDLLARWSSRHAVRSVTSLVSFLVFVVALLRS